MLNGPDALLPRRSFFRPVSMALQQHTQRLADFVVATTVAAHRSRAEVADFHGENMLKLSLDGEHAKPDCAFRLQTRDSRSFNYMVELDNSNEPIFSAKQRDSLARKVRFYDRYQDAISARMRVLFLFTGSESRMPRFLDVALSRADVSVDQRPGFHLYVDEFQDFATDSFATILSEARKYRVSLTLANQYLDQIKQQSPQTLSAVFGNVGSIIAFQVGSDDAEELARQLTKNEGDLLPADLTNLPKYTAYLRLLLDGIPHQPFSITTLPPRQPPKHPANLTTIRKVSHRRYGRPPDQVAKEIEKAFAA